LQQPIGSSESLVVEGKVVEHCGEVIGSERCAELGAFRFYAHKAESEMPRAPRYAHRSLRHKGSGAVFIGKLSPVPYPLDKGHQLVG
jgi:hypothetical protein